MALKSQSPSQCCVHRRWDSKILSRQLRFPVVFENMFMSSSLVINASSFMFALKQMYVFATELLAYFSKQIVVRC